VDRTNEYNDVIALKLVVVPLWPNSEAGEDCAKLMNDLRLHN